MCDTLVAIKDSCVFFAKNSDREPSEAQWVERIEAVENNTQARVKLTYIEVPQSAYQHGIIISRPYWMWGAEMGVNDRGVVIGNEAIFSRCVDKKGQALLGMDLVRLGLERGDDARHALSVITEHLERYGQAGPSGYRDKSFRYDNSFIVADATGAWVLETAGRHWVAKKVDQYAAISNHLSITSDYDFSSSGIEDDARRHGYCKPGDTFDFAKTFDTWLLPFFGAAHQRRATNLSHLQTSLEVCSLEVMAKHLRHHRSDNTDFSKHTNADVCFHAAGIHRPHQTCGSMVVGLSVDKSADILVTGTSSPCLSLFKPIAFDDENYFVDHTVYQGSQSSVWHEFEKVHRVALFDVAFRRRLLKSRESIERELFECYLKGGDKGAFDNKIQRWHEQWCHEVGTQNINTNSWHPYHRFWRKLNRMDGLK